MSRSIFAARATLAFQSPSLRSPLPRLVVLPVSVRSIMSPCWVMPSTSTVLQSSLSRTQNQKSKKFSTSSSSSSTTSTSAHSTTTHSQRGKRAVSLLPGYLADARAVTQYCPTTAPDGALQLGVAENQMLEDLLVPALSQYASTASTSDSDSTALDVFTADLIYYQPTHGRPPLRQAFSAYLERILSLPNDTLDPEGLVMGTGCNAVLENLCITLAEPGEGVMIPTPYYAAFEFDLVARAGLSIIPVNTFHHSGVVGLASRTTGTGGDAAGSTGTADSTSSDDSTSTTSCTSTDDDDDSTLSNNNNKAIPMEAYYPTKAGLTATLQAAREEGESPRILLISHPNNPLGISYPPNVVQDCIDWCRDNKIHLISDEIYAGSIHADADDTNTADDNNNNKFVSALSLGKTVTTTGTTNNKSSSSLGDYIHFVYSLSKDFALSGLRVGAVYSENQHIRMPLQKLNDLCQISSQTQVLVERMVTAKTNNDMFWTTEFLKENNSRIRARCNALQAVLDEFHVDHLKATSGLFCWIDMSNYLEPLHHDNDHNDESLESMQTRERALYLELMNDFGLLFTPGLSMKNERPGFFRCVFTAASDQEFALALERLRTFCLAKEQQQQE